MDEQALNNQGILRQALQKYLEDENRLHLTDEEAIDIVFSEGPEDIPEHVDEHLDDCVSCAEKCERLCELAERLSVPEGREELRALLGVSVEEFFSRPEQQVRLAEWRKEMLNRIRENFRGENPSE